jgi:TetR/AcrR family transcriptional repressor of nem operon
MRRSREDTQETRHRIVQAAARLFRERGIAATSVADVMSSLGLTVGGFYRHFASKEALVEEAIELASLQTAKGHANEIAAIVNRYLSDAHRRRPGQGCPVAALCSEAAHEPPPTKRAFTKALRRLLDTVRHALPREAAQRDTLYHLASSAVGALVLSRASSDEALARELLDAVRRRLIAETTSRPRARRQSAGTPRKRARS